MQELNREAPAGEDIGSDMKLISFDHVSPVTLNSEGTVRILDRLLGLQRSFERPNPDQKDTAVVGVDNENRPDFSSLPRIPEGSAGWGGNRQRTSHSDVCGGRGSPAEDTSTNEYVERS